MQPKNLFTTNLFFYLITLVVIVTALPTQTYAEDLKESQQKLDTLLLSLERTKKRLEKTSGEKSKLHKTFKKTEKEIGRLSIEQRKLSVLQKQLNKQLTELKQEQKELDSQQQQQQQLIGSHLRTAYEVGSQSPVQLLLENGDPAEIDRHLQYLERINQARAELVRGYRELLERKTQIASDITEKQTQVKNNQNLLSQQQGQLHQLQQKRSSSLKQLAKEVSSSEQKLQLLGRERNALETLIEEIGKITKTDNTRAPFGTPLKQQTTDQYASVWPDFNSAKGALPWPVPGKHKYRFGSGRANSDMKWQGVTITARTGTNVQAIFPGRVIFADWFKGQGLLIIVDHGNGYWSLYGHNESLLQSAGNTVDAGETIATVGNSGGQNLAALYFEIRKNGAPENPNHWCKQG